MTFNRWDGSFDGFAAYLKAKEKYKFMRDLQGATAVFPGLKLGVISWRAKDVSEEMIDASALALAMFSERQPPR
jgi:hypothetical protein